MKSSPVSKMETSGFHRRPVHERQSLLQEWKPHVKAEIPCLPKETGDSMIENFIGVIGFPLGVAPTFLIDGQRVVAPMVTEEPSVIAAATGIAKLVESSCGFVTNISTPIMTGNIYLLPLSFSAIDMINIVTTSADALIKTCNALCPSMVKRGGGVEKITAEILPHYNGNDRNVINDDIVSVTMYVNVCDSMGANVINSLAEGLAPHLESMTGAQAIMSILSNLSCHRLASASCRIPVKDLHKDSQIGMDVAKRMIQSWSIAMRDPYRATTHNKGIMNGVIAVATATGQDTRAIEAGAHAYAARSGTYQPLSKFWLEFNENVIDACHLNDALDDSGATLCASLTMPLAVGTVGGALHNHPGFHYCLSLLSKGDEEHVTAQSLSSVIVSVGLAQNIAAIRALVTEGIQHGHMALHKKRLQTHTS